MYNSAVIMSFYLFFFIYFDRLGVVPVFLVALIITLVLVFFPRTSENIPPFQEAEVFTIFDNKGQCKICSMLHNGSEQEQGIQI